MKVSVKIVLGLMSWLILAAFVAPAFAADPPKITAGYTACGAQASGVESDGRQLTGAFPRRFVGPDLKWHWCQEWVPDGGDPAMPRPAPEIVCAAGQSYLEWTQGEAVCNSVPPGAYVALSNGRAEWQLAGARCANATD